MNKKIKKNNSNNKKMNIVDTKLKPLIPTLRLRKRFVKVKIISDKKLDFKKISEALNEQLILFVGAIDYGKAGIWILRDKFNFEKQEITVKVSTKFKDKLLGSLALIQKIDSNNCKLEVIRVSGTLKGLEKK